MNTKNNSRFQKTDQKIRAAFLEELEKNGIEKVKVSTICQKAGINRSSFYAHFEDVYDILNHMSENFGREVYEMFRKSDNLSFTNILGEEEIIEFLDYLYQHRTFFHTYFQAFPMDCLGGSFEKTFSELIFPRLVLRGEPDSSVGRFHFIFFMGGFFAVIKQWLAEDCSKSPCEIARIIQNSLHSQL